MLTTPIRPNVAAVLTLQRVCTRNLNWLHRMPAGRHITIILCAAVRASVPNELTTSGVTPYQSMRVI
jgi:hypothetical protein